jgi:hypothetical protein
MATNQLTKEGNHVLANIGVEVSNIAVLYGQYSKLYLSGEDNLKTLKRVSPAFFEIVFVCLFESILIAIQRLCDPPLTMGKPNLTFEYLANELPEPCKTKFLDKLQAMRTRLNIVKQWRHKHLAHNDLAHSLGQTQLQPIEYDEIKAAIKDASDLLNIVVMDYLGGRYTMYEQVVVPCGAESVCPDPRKEDGMRM